MEKKAEYFYLSIFLMILMALNLFALVGVQIERKGVDKGTYPKHAGYERLEYGNYTAISGYAEYGVYWEFSCSNSSININVIAMDHSEFTSFEYYVETAGYNLKYALTLVTNYNLSSGETEDSGTWDVPEEGTWYILFIHHDEDNSPIYLSYDTSYDPESYDDYDPNLNAFFIFPIIFGSIVTFLIIFFIIFGITQYNKTQKQKDNTSWGSARKQNPYRGKKEKSFREAQKKRGQIARRESNRLANRSNQTPITDKKKKAKNKENCRFCGEKIDADAEFCPWCGTKLK